MAEKVEVGAKMARSYEVEPIPPYSLRATFTGTEPAFPSVFDGRCLWRVVRASSGTLVPLRVEQVGPPDDPLLLVEVLPSSPPASEADVEEALRALCRFLCTGDDLSSAYAKMAADQALRPILPYVRGMMPWTAFTPVEGLINAIVFQQISLRVAFSIMERFVKGLGEAIRVRGRILYAFPSLDAIMRAGQDGLRMLGLSRNKASYILGIAEALEEGQLDLEALSRLPVGRAIGELTALRGVGRWTAELFLATGLKRWEVVPADDLGVRRAFSSIYGLEKPSGEAIRALCSRWGRDAWPIAYSMLVWAERRERLLKLVGRGARILRVGGPAGT